MTGAARVPLPRWLRALSLGGGRSFALSFALAAGLFLVAAGVVYVQEHRRIVNEEYGELETLSRGGIRELEAWRRERLDEVSRFTTHRRYARAVAALMRGDPPGRAWPLLLAEAEVLLTRPHYEAFFLLDPTGEVRFVAGSGLNRGTRMEIEARGALDDDAPRFLAVGQGADLRIRLLAPLRGRDGRAVGLVGVQLNPQLDLPSTLITGAPFAGGGVADLLLLSGERVIAPDPQQRPIAAFRTVAALRAGFEQATDQGGRSVVITRLPLSGTPWVLVGQVDEAAFAAGVRRLNFWTALLLLAFLGSAAGLTYLGWRRGQAQQRLREVQAQRELKLMERRFDYLAKFANDAIILADQERRILEVNDKAIAMYGYSREEFKGMRVEDIRAPEALVDIDRDWAIIGRAPSALFETVGRTKEGRPFPVEVSACQINIEGRRYVQGIVRDISERKLAEERERKLKGLYAALSRANEAMARHYTREALMPEICRIAVENAGYTEAYVALEEHGELKVVARYGELGQAATDDVFQGAVRQTQGPLIRAFREGHAAVCNDFTADPLTVAAHAGARHYGINAAAAFPLRLEQRVVGAFGIVSKERNAFDEAQMQLLQDLAQDISQALENYALDQQRRTAEQMTQESEARHRALFENMGSGVLVAVRDGERFLVKDINTALEQIEGVQRRDVVGRDLTETFSWVEHCLAPVVEQVWRSGRSQEIPVHSHPRDHHGWRETYVYRLPQQEVVAVINDVTDRMRAAEALRRSEERLALVLEGTNEAYWDFNFEDGEVYYSQRFAEMFGYRPEELGTGIDSWQRLVHPNDVIEVQRLLADHLAGKTREFVSDHRMRHRERGYLWVRARGRVVRRAEDGHPLRMAGTHSDITAQRGYEEYLRLWATVFEQSREAIMVTDAQRRIVSVNRAFTEITGFTAEEVKGNRPSILSSGVHDRAFYQTMWAAIGETGHWQGEIQDRRKSGEIVPMWTAITAVRDGEGRVQNYISIGSDISERKEAEERIRYLAYHDALTALPNRSLFIDRLNFELAHAQRHARHAAVMFMDLDRFKHVNDSLGHAYGDQLLNLVAERLHACVRKEDTVGRQGGDEFLVLLTDLQQTQDAINVARKAIREIEKPFRLDGVEVRVTASIGIALYPEDGDTGDTLIRNADAAMYEAKERGRNNFQFFTEELNRRARTRLSLETDLRRAVAGGEFVLHYQPQVALSNGAVVGVEALLRWRHEGRLVAPGDFLPFAEEVGLMVPIGEWVIHEACRQQAEWHAEGMPVLRVGVNVSASQFRLKDWAARLRAAVDGCAAGNLELELTEGVLMQAESGAAILRVLKDLGLALTLDDFGTGFSNLSSLRHFPIDRLKVDRSFVHDLAHDPVDRAVTEAIIHLARGLGIRVVAAGVEAEEELQLLKAQRCDEVQGRLVAPPLAADELLLWWREKIQGAAPGHRV